MQSSSPAAISLALFLWSLLGPTARAEDFHASRKLLDAAPQCSRAGQFVADTTTACKSFWQCTGPGQGSYQSCGSGTAFDSGCSCCNFPSAFTCSSTPASANTAASPSPPSNPVPTSPPPASPASSNPSAGSPPSASSCTAANQFVPDTAVGCAKFWQCTGPQQGVYQSCNTGLIFDTSCNCCNFPSSSNCKAASPSTSSPSSQPSTGVPASPSPSSTTPTPSGSGIGSFVTADLFGQIFKHTNDAVCQHPNFYTYQSFTSAAGAFPGFGTSKDAATNKREVAAFLAQISHETTGGPASNNDYSWGLCFDEERTSDPYCDQSSQCAPGVSYHGRGPIQLSWNYNYGPAGSALGFDGINNPGAVLSDATLAWKTAIRFWMTAAGNKPSCHDVMNGNWQPSSADSAAGRLPGFGTVTNVINGGIECGPGRTNSAGGPDRIAYFQRYVYLLGTDAGANLSCDNQQHF